LCTAANGLVVLCPTWGPARLRCSSSDARGAAGAAPDSGHLGADADGAPLLLLHSRAARRACALRLPPPRAPPRAPGAPGAQVQARRPRTLVWVCRRCSKAVATHGSVRLALPVL